MNRHEMLRRNANWQVLRKSGVVLLWEPFMIDLGISYPFGIRAPSELLKSPLFLSWCAEKAKKIQKYQGFCWRSEETAAKAQTGEFFYNFLKRGAQRLMFMGRKMGTFEFKEDVFDEICSVILEKVAESVANFRPCARNKKTSWGFEAYLQNYSLKNAIRGALDVSGVADKRRATVSLEEFAEGAGGEDKLLSFSSESEGPEQIGENECRDILRHTVGKVLAGHIGAEVYIGHIIRGQTIRDVGLKLGMPKSKCHRLLAKACLDVWQAVRKDITRGRPNHMAVAG